MLMFLRKSAKILFSPFAVFRVAPPVFSFRSGKSRKIWKIIKYFRQADSLGSLSPWSLSHITFPQFISQEIQQRKEISESCERQMLAAPWQVVPTHKICKSVSDLLLLDWVAKREALKSTADSIASCSEPHIQEGGGGGGGGRGGAGGRGGGRVLCLLHPPPWYKYDCERPA